MKRFALLVCATLALVCSTLLLLNPPAPSFAQGLLTATPTLTTTPLPTGTPQPTAAPPTAVPTLTSCDAIPPAPQLVSPQKRALLIPTTIVLKWSKIPCKPFYWLEVRRESQRGPAVVTQTLKKKAFVVTLAPGWYAWRVTACTFDGCSASEWRKFRLGPLPSPPTPPPTWTPAPPLPTATPHGDS